MSVFSGVIPTIKVSKNSQINNLTGGLLNNLATSTASVAINQTLGAEVTAALGLNPAAGSNFQGSIVTPGLVSTGVGALGQAVTNSIVNSGALDSLGALTSGLTQAGLSYVSNAALQGLFGSSANSNTSLYFPGAGGPGEGPANYGQGTNSVVSTLLGNRKSVYAIGRGGRSTTDVLFSITPSLSTAAKEASAATGGSSGSQPGSTPTAPAPAGAVPAGAPSPGAAPPEPTPAGEAVGTPPSPAPQEGWKFICAPEDISWETTVGADRVPIFGANYAPVQAGIRGMRELTLNGAIVEGFTRSVTVENKIKLLEDLTRMSISADKRYLQIPVYKVTAQNKIYGAGTSTSEGGHFVIKSIRVQEKIRDFDGNTTRAIVDVGLIQVPAYQVEEGRDIASPTISGAKGPFEGIKQAVEKQAQQNVTPATKSPATASPASGTTPSTTPKPQP